MDYRLVPMLDRLKEIKLDKVNINILADTISLHLIDKDKKKENVDVRFDGVSSFYYIDESKEDSDKSIIYNSKVNSISYCEDGLGEFSTFEEDYGEFGIKLVTIPNFAIDMKDYSLFIEAESIAIDGKKFDVSSKKI